MRIALLTVALLLPQDKNEAEELFKKMEEKLSAVNSIFIKVRTRSVIKIADLEGGPGTQDESISESQVYIVPASELRIEFGSTPVRALMIGNGSRLKLWPGSLSKKGKLEAARLPPAFTHLFLSDLARGGFGRATERLLKRFSLDPENPELTQVPKLRGFLLKGEERVGDREARVISYLDNGLHGWKVWIDRKSHLPLKRQPITEGSDEESPITETYAEYRLNEAIDHDRFTMPGDKADLDAEDLFRKMVDGFLMAKSIQLEHRVIVHAEQVELKGETMLSDGNRASLTLAAKQDASPGIRLLSDGRELVVTASGKTLRLKAAPSYGNLLRSSLGLAGVSGAAELGQSEPSDNPISPDIFSATDFRMAGKEKLDGRETQVIEYRLSRPRTPVQTVKVWIDVATLLPKKRLLKRGTATVTEYTPVFVFDANLDPAKFEIPKDAK